MAWWMICNQWEDDMWQDELFQCLIEVFVWLKMRVERCDFGLIPLEFSVLCKHFQYSSVVVLHHEVIW